MRLRPALKIGCTRSAPTAQVPGREQVRRATCSRRRPTRSAPICGNTWPPRRRRCARWPRPVCCSACWMSGRRSSSDDGRPAGTAGGRGWSISAWPRAIGPGFAREQHAQRVLHLRGAALHVGDLRRAPSTSCSAWRTSTSGVAPPRSRTTVRRSDSSREASVRVAISSCRSSARSTKYCDATSLTRLVTMARCPHSVRARSARAASVARRYLPQKSSLPRQADAGLHDADRRHPRAAEDRAALALGAHLAGDRRQLIGLVMPSCAAACSTRVAAMRASRLLRERLGDELPQHFVWKHGRPGLVAERRGRRGRIGAAERVGRRDRGPRVVGTHGVHAASVTASAIVAAR